MGVQLLDRLFFFGRKEGEAVMEMDLGGAEEEEEEEEREWRQWRKGDTMAPVGCAVKISPEEVEEPV